MTARKLTAAILLAVFTFLFSEDITTYTSISRGYGIGVWDGIVYAGTDGGFIMYDDGEGTVFDTDDGIYKPVISIVEKDFRDILWLGHPDCSITLFDPGRRTSVYLDDIEQAGVYALNNIFSSDEYVYIATSGLLARYRYNTSFGKYEIADLNSMTGNVKDVKTAGGNIYLCTDSGVFMIEEDSPNINYMSNWKTVAGLETSVCSSLAENNGKIFILTDNGLYSLEGQTAVKESVFDGVSLIKGYFTGGEFLASHEQVGATVISSVPDDLLSSPIIIYGTEDENFKSFIMPDSTFLYFTSTGGLSYYNMIEESEHSLTFNCPREKGIKKVIYDQEASRLLYLTNYAYSYADIFDMSFYPDMFISRGNATNFLSSGDALYVCTWGNGLNCFQKEENGYVFERNYDFGDPVNVTNYPVHPGIAEDSSGRIWVTNWNDNNEDSVLVLLSHDGIVEKAFPVTDFIAYDVYADFYNGETWLWLGSSKQSFGAQDGIGVGIYKNNALKIKTIAVSEGVIDIVRDDNNIVWIATNNGIKYIDLSLSPSDPMNFSTTNLNTIQSGPIGNMIYDVEVNSIGEKWFATDGGISVLSADNDKWRHYVPLYCKDTPNVPGEIVHTGLPDKLINDIEFDENNGTAIIATYNGISVLEYGNIFKTGKVNKGDIQTKPSPFINDGSSVMGFYLPEDGNTYDTGKIFDMKGFLVRGGDGGNRFDIRDGWDGRDNKGKTVSTGIYKIIIYNRNDPEKNISGKIAVVRK